MLFANPEGLTQVLFNLLQNARKATEQGAIIITAQPSGNYITVTVTDTGSGIPPDILPRVFERGVSGSDSTGLGLPICKEIIEAHGGEISIHNSQCTINNEKAGTKVIFTLPVYDESVDEK